MKYYTPTPEEEAQWELDAQELSEDDLLDEEERQRRLETPPSFPNDDDFQRDIEAPLFRVEILIGILERGIPSGRLGLEDLAEIGEELVGRIASVERGMRAYIDARHWDEDTKAIIMPVRDAIKLAQQFWTTGVHPGSQEAITRLRIEALEQWESR